MARVQLFSRIHKEETEERRNNCKRNSFARCLLDFHLVEKKEKILWFLKQRTVEERNMTERNAKLRNDTNIETWKRLRNLLVFLDKFLCEICGMSRDFSSISRWKTFVMKIIRKYFRDRRQVIVDFWKVADLKSRPITRRLMRIQIEVEVVRRSFSSIEHFKPNDVTRVEWFCSTFIAVLVLMALKVLFYSFLRSSQTIQSFACLSHIK